MIESSLGSGGVRSWVAAGSDLDSVVLRSHPPAGFAEAFIAPKSSADVSEDVLVLTPHFVAVIDGMSSPLRSPGRLGSGREYALATGRAISELPARADARTAIDRITDRLSRITASHAGPAGCVAAIYSANRRELWRVGDIHIAIGMQTLPAHKEVDEAMTGFRAAINAAKLAAGTPLHVIRTTDPGLAAARALLEVQPLLANRNVPFGYGVLNGTTVPDQLIEVFAIPDERCWLRLASDGYLSPASSLAHAEAELFDAINADPASIGVMRDMGKALQPGADAPDDRTYVRLFVEQRDAPGAR